MSFRFQYNLSTAYREYCVTFGDVSSAKTTHLFLKFCNKIRIIHFPLPSTRCINQEMKARWSKVEITLFIAVFHFFLRFRVLEIIFDNNWHEFYHPASANWRSVFYKRLAIVLFCRFVKTSEGRTVSNTSLPSRVFYCNKRMSSAFNICFMSIHMNSIH